MLCLSATSATASADLEQYKTLSYENGRNGKAAHYIARKVYSFRKPFRGLNTPERSSVVNRGVVGIK